MRKIHFDKIGGNKMLIGLMILAIACITMGEFEIIEFTNPKINTYLSAAGFLILVINYSKMFWHKNYVQWNRKIIVIRIKSFLGKHIRFSEIKETEIKAHVLEISKTNGKKVLIDLIDIAQSDAQKLNEIIIKNTTANCGAHP